MKKLTRILALTLCCLLAAGLLDCFDGRIARTKKDRSHQQQSFGIQIPVRRSAGTPRSRTRESPMKMTSSPILSWPATPTGTA